MILCALAVMLDGFAAQMMGYIAPSLAHDMHLAPCGAFANFRREPDWVDAGRADFRPDRRPLRTQARDCYLHADLRAVHFGHCIRAIPRAASPRCDFWRDSGFGGVMPNAIALTAEYSPQRRRGTMITIMFCGFPIGATIVGFAAVPILPAYGWRGVFIFAGVMPLAAGSCSGAAAARIHSPPCNSWPGIRASKAIACARESELVFPATRIS